MQVVIMRLHALRLVGLLFFLGAALSAAAPRIVELPDGGLQPRVAVDAVGVLHVVYFQGADTAGDLFYVRSSDGGQTFSTPLAVNSQPGSAVAAGAIRGAQIALGKAGSVHVVWNGSTTARPKGPPYPEAPPDSPHSGLPLLYTRLNAAGDAFEPQRNLMQHTFALDGGGTVAADGQGGVFVAWHGKAAGAAEGEGGRRVYLTRSLDDGATFDRETAISPAATGACGCCGMKLFAASDGTLYGLYRTATDVVHRDMELLVSTDRGRTFRGEKIHEWEISACPMSSMSFDENGGVVAAAWETEGQVYWARLSRDPNTPIQPVAAAGGDGERRKYPDIAINDAGDVLLSWADVAGWKKPGALHWQLFPNKGTQTPAETASPALPVWSFPAVFAAGRSGFGILR